MTEQVTPPLVRLVYDPISFVSIVCGCGRSFMYEGIGASEKSALFMREHPCRLRREQRTGDEPV